MNTLYDCHQSFLFVSAFRNYTFAVSSNLYSPFQLYVNAFSLFSRIFSKETYKNEQNQPIGKILTGIYTMNILIEMTARIIVRIVLASNFKLHLKL